MLIVNFFVKNKDWGRGRGGLIERGGKIEDLRYVILNNSY